MPLLASRFVTRWCVAVGIISTLFFAGAIRAAKSHHHRATVRRANAGKRKSVLLGTRKLVKHHRTLSGGRQGRRYSNNRGTAHVDIFQARTGRSAGLGFETTFCIDLWSIFTQHREDRATISPTHRMAGDPPVCVAISGGFSVTIPRGRPSRCWCTSGEDERRARAHHRAAKPGFRARTGLRLACHLRPASPDSEIVPTCCGTVRPPSAISARLRFSRTDIAHETPGFPHARHLVQFWN